MANTDPKLYKLNHSMIRVKDPKESGMRLAHLDDSSPGPAMLTAMPPHQ
jgi:hypothetical protein